jgi:hypothetical protein
MASVATATTVSLDEPCLWVRETVRKTPNQRQRRRYRSTGVVRNDAPAEHLEDLGPEDKAEEFQILGYGVETVGYLREQADKYREQLITGVAIPQELIHSTNLVEEYVKARENKAMHRSKKSTFGPGGETIRL